MSLLFPSIEIQASQKKWDLTVKYELDYYRMRPTVEVRLANYDISRDYKYDISLGVINGSELEQEFNKNDVKFRYNSLDKFVLDNFDGDSRLLSIIINSEDPSEPLKQLAFQIYNFPDELYEIDTKNYTYKFKKEILANYNANTLEIKYEYLDFGALLDTGNLISSTVVDFSKWNFHYDIDGVLVKRGYDSAQVCFSDGFEDSTIEYVDNVGYCFDLKYKKIEEINQEPKVGFELINTYYDEKNDNYHKENINDEFIEVKTLKLKSNKENIDVTLRINKQGINNLNFIYRFTFNNEIVNNPGEFDISNDCSQSRFCIVKLDETLELTNYKSYKVGELN